MHHPIRSQRSVVDGRVQVLNKVCACLNGASSAPLEVITKWWSAWDERRRGNPAKTFEKAYLRIKGVG